MGIHVPNGIFHNKKKRKFDNQFLQMISLTEENSNCSRSRRVQYQIMFGRPSVRMSSVRTLAAGNSPF